MTTRQIITPQPIGDYYHPDPLPDPPREPDMRQFEALLDFGGTIKPFFHDRDDVLVSGGGYLINSPGDPLRFAPDGMVVIGVNNPDGIILRNGYVISEVGKPPDFVLEVASRSTGRRDYTIKRDGYAAMGVREYWRFDPSGGRFHDAPLGGDRLNDDGEYTPLPITSESESRHWGYSEVLGLELWWYDEELRFRNPVTGEFLPTPEESWDMSERASAAYERERAAHERTSAALEASEAREAALEAELRRLRGE